MAKVFDRLAWGDETTQSQRQAYYDFTIQSTNLSERSKQQMANFLVNRYEKRH